MNQNSDSPRGVRGVRPREVDVSGEIHRLREDILAILRKLGLRCAPRERGYLLAHDELQETL